MLPAIIGIAGFWNNLPAPIRKAIEYVALIGIALYAMKVFWLNPHDARIEAEAKIKMAQELDKDFDARYKQQIKSLQDANADLRKENGKLEDRAGRLQAINDELARSRESIVGHLNATLATIKAIGATQHANDSAVPDYMLDGLLRSVSNDLECAKSGSAGKPGCPSAINVTGKKTNP